MGTYRVPLTGGNELQEAVEGFVSVSVLKVLQDDRFSLFLKEKTTKCSTECHKYG